MSSKIIIISLINPDKGSVWADDEEIGQENFLNWQRGIGYVAQDVNLLDLSIQDQAKVETDNIINFLKNQNLLMHIGKKG